jgi:hypothetical protein
MASWSSIRHNIHKGYHLAAVGMSEKCCRNVIFLATLSTPDQETTTVDAEFRAILNPLQSLPAAVSGVHNKAMTIR